MRPSFPTSPQSPHSQGPRTNQWVGPTEEGGSSARLGPAPSRGISLTRGTLVAV